MNIRELIQVVDNQELSEVQASMKMDPSGQWTHSDTGEPVDNTVPFPNQQQQQPKQGKFAKAWDVAKQAASAAGKGLGKAASATAQGVKKYGPGVARGAANLATGATKAAGDIAAQATGGAAQALGAVPGGFKKGYQTARAGQQFKADPGSAPAAPSQDPAAAGQSEINDLRQMISRIDAKLAKHGLTQ
jgi:hypothetical protein